MQVLSYLTFEGRCEEALAFYRKAIGAEIDMMMRFKDAPETPSEGCVTPGSDDKIMHASFHVGETMVMATDGRCSGTPTFHGFSLSITAADEAEATRLFNGLADGGQVQMPLGQTFFSPCFGVVADRFGVSWMIIVEP